MADVLQGAIVALIFALFAPRRSRSVVGRLVRRVHDWQSDPVDGDDAVEEVHELYFADEIDEEEMEARLDILVDDRKTTVRDMCDDVEGIGEELSLALAEEFDSAAELHAADSEDLQRVDGIGDERGDDLEAAFEF